MMKQINAKEMIATLKNDVLEMIEVVESNFLQAEHDLLYIRPDQKKWSIIECLEHINIANGIYVERINTAITHWTSSNLPAKATFSPGVLGNYFVKTMKPTEKKEIKNKMKTFKLFVPATLDKLDKDKILNDFLAQHKAMLRLLTEAEQVDLGKIKIKSALGGWLMFKLGDAFRFIIGHSQRHIIQAQEAMDVIKPSITI